MDKYKNWGAFTCFNCGVKSNIILFTDNYTGKHIWSRCSIHYQTFKNLMEKEGTRIISKSEYDLLKIKNYV